MLDLSRNIIFLLSLPFVRSTHTRPRQYVPDILKYTENLVPDDRTRNYPVIPLTLGYVRGNWLTSSHGRRYAAYKGVPYAQPPLGNLRFEPPQEKKAWFGVRDALNHGPQCPQILFLLNKYVGHEDCLYLNLYIPQPDRGNEPRNSRDELLPIILFIHGGAWVLGAGDMDNYLYGPDRIMDEDVILVTINYRLGAMGFLYLENNTVSGNMGLKDQAMALKLIKANARSFGGDPDRIIIMGESAGGASAEYHTMNPESRKLISGTIAQSGSVLAAWAWTRPDVLATRTRRLARIVNCPDNLEPYYILDCLKRASSEDIVRNQFYTDRSPLQIPIGVSFTPTIEPPESFNPFLRECPRDILVRLRETRERTTPFLTGYNTLEGELFTKIAIGLVDSFLQSGARLAPWGLGTSRELKDVTYWKEKPYILQASSQIINNLLGDMEFKAPIIDSSRYHANAGSNVYLYHFSFSGRNNFARLFWNNQEPTHMDELTYLFVGRGLFSGLPSLDNPSPEAAVSKRLIRMWTNFAKTGNPTPENDTGVGVQWPLGPSKLLVIGEKLTVDDSPLETGWSGFIDKQCSL